MKKQKTAKKLASLTIAFALVLTLFTLAPVSVSAVGDAYSTISATFDQTFALKGDGSLWAWGWNFYGQLGDGTTEGKLTPTKIMDGVAQVSAGSRYTLAVKSDGSLWAWGNNSSGQLGDGTTENKHTPVKIMDGVVQVSAGDEHTLAIKNDGSLWAWGQNYFGELGDGTTEEKHNPVKIMDGVAQVSAGSRYTLAIKNDGSLWAWGNNSSGQLGDGTWENRYSPIKIMDGVAQVSTGWSHTVVVKSDGSLWAWGWNSSGQLGDGTTEGKLTPKKIMDGIAQVSAGINHTMAIKSDGSLWAWGSNSNGQLGDGTTEGKLTPTKIMDGVAQVSAGVRHTLATKSDGSLWACGSNSNGQLGDGTVTTYDDNWNIIENNNKSTPIKIMDDVMLSSGANTPPISAPEYIYDSVDPGESMKLPVHLLPGVTDQTTAVAAIQEAASGMTDEQKQSATGIDLVTLFAEEAVAQAASTTVTGNSVTIDQTSVQALQATADSTKTAAEQALAAGGIDTQREISTTVKFRVDAKTVTVTIDPSAKNAAADNVRIETPGFAVTFSAEAIAQNAADTPFVITIAAAGANTYTIEYNQPVNERIKVSLPPLPGDPTYQAIIDASGNAIGGKFNPVTGMLEAKTNPSNNLSVKENKKDFTDIGGKSGEMQKAIEVLASKGIINGKSATTFAPDSPITRAEIAALITRTLSKYKADEDGGFSDVKKADWYFGACGSAKTHGIMNGTSATTFAPNVNIPKDQIVCVAARVLRKEMKYKSPTNVTVGEVLKVYNDAGSLADWSRTDIALATHANLVVRRSDGEFRPNTTMTRGDAAIVLYRMFLKIW